MMSRILMTARGLNGQVELYEHCVRIKRRGCLGVLFQLSYGMKGDKDILLDSITGVQLKAAGFGNGYIRFEFPGANEPRGGLSIAKRDENAIEFSRWRQKEFEALRDAIYQLRACQTQGTPGAAAPPGSIQQAIVLSSQAARPRTGCRNVLLVFLVLVGGCGVLSLFGPSGRSGTRGKRSSSPCCIDS